MRIHDGWRHNRKLSLVQWSLRKDEDGASLIPEARASGPSKLTRDKAGRDSEEKAKTNDGLPIPSRRFLLGARANCAPSATRLEACWATFFSAMPLAVLPMHQ